MATTSVRQRSTISATCAAIANNNVSMAICTVACLMGSQGIAVAEQAAANWRKRGVLPAVCIIGGEGGGKWCGLVQVIALPQPIDLMLAEPMGGTA
jgi:hypothetical protein